MTPTRVTPGKSKPFATIWVPMRMFVAALRNCPTISTWAPRREVVRAINALALGIGAQVIAEGIETDRELSALRELGVRYGQGYYFGAALHAQ